MNGPHVPESAGEDGGDGGDEPLGRVGPHDPHRVLPLQAQPQESPVRDLLAIYKTLLGRISNNVMAICY